MCVYPISSAMATAAPATVSLYSHVPRPCMGISTVGAMVMVGMFSGVLWSGLAAAVAAPTAARVAENFMVTGWTARMQN